MTSTAGRQRHTRAPTFFPSAPFRFFPAARETSLYQSPFIFETNTAMLRQIGSPQRGLRRWLHSFSAKQKCVYCGSKATGQPSVGRGSVPARGREGASRSTWLCKIPRRALRPKPRTPKELATRSTLTPLARVLSQGARDPGRRASPKARPQSQTPHREAQGLAPGRRTDRSRQARECEQSSAVPSPRQDLLS